MQLERLSSEFSLALGEKSSGGGSAVDMGIKGSIIICFSCML